MARTYRPLLASALVALLCAPHAAPPSFAKPYKYRDVETALPAARVEGGKSVEAALAARRSAREFKDEPATLADLSQLLWAAQGVTAPRGLRTTPSAGMSYPLELYAVTGAVADLMPGVYRYRPKDHSIERVVDGDLRNALHLCALRQTWVRDAPFTLVLAFVKERVEKKYPGRGRDFACLEAGHAAQNVLLQAESMGMGAVAIGAFQGAEVRRLIKLPDEEEALYLVTAGKR